MLHKISERKPGKLKPNQMVINLDAMKPGAVNGLPLFERRRRTLSNKMNQYNTNIPSKLDPDAKRRKTYSSKSKKSLPPKRPKPDDEKAVKAAPKLFKKTINKPLNPIALNNIKKIAPEQSTTPPTEPPVMDLSPTNSLSLIEGVPTPFDGENKDLDVISPRAPATPTSPMPPKHIQMKENGRFDVLSIPPQPPPPVLTSIDKAPRDTAASTTFTIRGQKITVIGHARTGKTSIKNALFGRKFQHMTFPTVKAPLKPTLVVKPLQFDKGDEGDMNVQYEVWDTPGQKVLEYIPPLYITGAFCVLVVYDITDVYSYERAKYWIQYLEENAKGYDNVVLIGNKHDLQNTQECVDSDEVQFYAEQHGIFFIEISVKTKYNFDVLLAWLNTKTQEKFLREMEIDNDKIKYEEWENETTPQGDGGRINKKPPSKQRKKEWIKQHQRHQKTIDMDKIDVHSKNTKRNGCCLVS